MVPAEQLASAHPKLSLLSWGLKVVPGEGSQTPECCWIRPSQAPVLPVPQREPSKT